MNVQEQIDNGNNSFLAPAEQLRKEGRHVLVVYSGQHAVGFEPFDTQDEAFAALSKHQATAADPSAHFKVLLPTGVDVSVDRPQLSDGNVDNATLYPNADGPALTPEEDGELQVAANQRDRALTALQAAAMAFTKAQEHCTALAVKLRARMEQEAREQGLIPAGTTDAPKVEGANVFVLDSRPNQG